MTFESFPPPRKAVDPLDDELARLLVEPLAGALPAKQAAPSGRLRERLLDRVVRSARAASALITVRHDTHLAEQVAPHVRAARLYRSAGDPRRSGEPRRAQLIELEPGAVWAADAAQPSDRVEWLVLRGQVEFDAEALAALDYRHQRAGTPSPVLRSTQGALVYRRDSPQSAVPPAAVSTVRNAESEWDEFGPGIRRRVLWTEAGEASLLYHTLPGASVPGHGHGHDEECLMIDGELFLDDVLLRRYDWQLAPAGSGHAGVYTDTGVVLFAHGDLQVEAV